MFIESKDQGHICNLFIIRIPKLSLIIEIDEELIQLFRVMTRPNVQKDDKNVNQLRLFQNKGGIVYVFRKSKEILLN